MHTDNTINALNSLLSGEISAVESYKKALQGIKNESLIPEFEELQISHARRAQRLRQLVESGGGVPNETSGAWGIFARSLEGTATVFGDTAAINVLEEGEDKGLKDYEDRLGKLDGEARFFVESELYPEQQLTHKRMSDLKHRFS